MPAHVSKSIEITGSSTVSVDEAIRAAVAKSTETVRNVEWFKVVSTRGHVADEKLYFQVTLKIGFRLD